MKIGIIIQARVGSTRLRGKVLKKIKNKTILSHVITRVKQCKKVDEIIIATTTKEEDNLIEKESIKNKVKVFRGSELNVLERYYLCGKKYNLDIIVRITSDCPLVDPILVDKMIEYFLNKDLTMVSTAGLDPKQRTYPRGLDAEVFTFKSLEESYNKATKDFEKEHVTQYIYNHCKKIEFYKNNIDYSGYRLTVDTKEDFDLIEKIYELLYKGKHDFYLKEIVKVIENNKEILKLNEGVTQKEVDINEN